MNKVKDQINKRGSKLSILGKTFRSSLSYDGNTKINKEDFIFSFKELGIVLDDSEYEVLLCFLDKDKDQMVNFDEFLVAIRGRPNTRRQAIIDKSFLKFDKDGTGLIKVTDIREVFNCIKHPKVVCGEMNDDQVFAQLLKHFNDYGEGTIERKEWNDYYSVISSSIDNDDHFVLLMKTAWNLD
jgi:Ca2+-binding EF-hand superfamily protein